MEGPNSCEVHIPEAGPNQLHEFYDIQVEEPVNYITFMSQLASLFRFLRLLVFRPIKSTFLFWRRSKQYVGFMITQT